MNKPLLKSKTMWWHGLLTALGASMAEFSRQFAPIVDQLGPTGLQPEWVARIGVGLAVLGIIGGFLRGVTTQGVSLKGNGQ